MIDAPARRRRIWRRVLLYGAWLVYGSLLALLALGWFSYLGGGMARLPDAYLRDFLGIYVGARLMIEGHGGQLYDLAVQQQVLNAVVAPYENIPFWTFIYPPYMAVLLAPLGWLSYTNALFLVEASSTVLAGLIIYRLVVVTTQDGAERLALVLGAASFVPLWRTLLQGQLSVWPLLGLTGAALALRGGRTRTAGLWLCLGLFKPQLIALPLLLFVLERRGRALTVLGVSAAALVGGTLLLFGNWLPSYAYLLTEASTQVASQPDLPELMLNWRGMVYALLGNDRTPLAVALQTGLVGLSVAAVIGIGWPRPQWGRTTGEVRLAVATLLGLLVVPHLYLHDLVLVLLPGFLLWRAVSAALAAHPGVYRLYLLRGMLALAPLLAFVTQLGQPPSLQLFSCWIVALVLLVFATWNLLDAEPAASRAVVVLDTPPRR